VGTLNPYQEHLNRHSDIQEHLGLLRGLAMQCDTVVELGFRTGVSTSAFLAADAQVTSYDLDPRCKVHVQRLAKLYPDKFTFRLGDSRQIEIPECDLLFIDTDHTEQTTWLELYNHADNVKMWIVLHDTVSFGRRDRPPGRGKGVLTAVDRFLTAPSQGDWVQWLHLTNNNGLTLLKRR
jgi:predicted O-methyltransferase YrrM